MHYQRFLHKNPLLQSLAQHAKKGVLCSYRYMCLIIFLHTKKPQIPSLQVTILLIYAYVSAQIIIKLNLKTTGF